jgi:predicted acyltransferase
VPGYGAGVLEPQGNLCWYIDSRLLAGHTWRGAPVPGFDPEGLLSTFPAVATTLLGMFTGDWLRTSRTEVEKCCTLFAFGTVAIVLGLVWNIWFPINKSLWTSSYVLFMAGMALHFLGMCVWLVDIRGLRRWGKPFVVFGSNAIVVFALSSLLADVLSTVHILRAGQSITLKSFFYQALFASWAGPLNGSLLYAIAYILFWLGCMVILFRKRVFIKV